MKNQADYSQYKCPYEHIDKECGHELHGPEGYEDVHGVWCACGFRGPVFCLKPGDLKLERKEPECKHGESLDGCCNACADSGKDPRKANGRYIGLDRAKKNT